MGSESPECVIGIAWYDRDQWLLLTRVAADRANLDDTYEAWEAHAAEAQRVAEAAGRVMVRVPIDVPKLASWCRKKHLPNNSASRAEYAAQLLRLSSRGGG